MGLGSFRQNILPYCMEEQPDSGWVFLNREYQPIGFNKQEFGDYERKNLTVYFRRFTPKQIDIITVDPMWRERWLKGHRKIWLYDDGCMPDMRSAYRTQKQNAQNYFEKLDYLMRLSTYSLDDIERSGSWNYPKIRRKLIIDCLPNSPKTIFPKKATSLPSLPP